MSRMLDDLMAEVYATYQQQDPGVQAKVEQHAATIRQELASRSLALTREHLRTYVANCFRIGLEEDVSPDVPSREADWLGNRIAACSLLAAGLSD